MRTITLSRKVISRLTSTLLILVIAAILLPQAFPIRQASAAVVIADDDGTLIIPAGTHTATYVTVFLQPPTIDAVNDDFSGSPINGFTGGTTATVYSNDTLDTLPFLDDDVIPSISADGGLTGVDINDDGTLIIPASTSAGNYTVTYEICEAADDTNCDTADVTVLVQPPAIVAVNDNFSGSPINGTTGGTTATVFSNDTLNGASFPNGAVTLTITDDDGLTGLTPNANGTLTVPASSDGTYTVTYEICEVLNPTNCDTATATIVVGLTVINAVNDDFTGSPIDGFTGGTTATVFSNDTLNGASFSSADVTLTITNTGGLTGVTPNANGTLNVPGNTPANTYTVTYEICAALDPASCDTATATIAVDPPVINAVNDDFSGTTVNGFTGGSTPTVFSNDTLSGVSFPSTAVALTITNTGGLTGVTPNASGTLTVPASTSANTYIVTYEICDVLNPTNCDTATATIRVSTIDAVNNNFSGSPVNGTTGGTTGSVFGNDRLNGVSFASADVQATVTNTGGLAGLTITSTGRMSIPAGTAANTYVATYQICEAANLTNCDTANVTIRVILSSSITKSRSRSSAVPGETVVYTVVVRNTLSITLNNVEVFDPLDDYVDYVSASTTRGSRSYDSGTHVVIFNIGTLSAGQSATLTITVRVSSNAARPSTISNTATLFSTEAGERDSNTVEVSVPAISPTATPRPTSTPTGSGQLPDTGEPPPPYSGILWIGLALSGISLALLIGLAILLVLRQYHKAEIWETGRRISKWAGMGLLITVLMLVVLVALKSKPEQAAGASPASSGLETTDQPSVVQAFLGLWQADQPSTTSPQVSEAQSSVTPIPSATRLIVPTLDLEANLIEAPLVNGEWDVSGLSTNVAHLETTAYPGTRGNAVLAGHVLLKQEGFGPFYELEKMKPGDRIVAEGPGVSYIYRVEWVKVVSPSDMYVVSPTDVPVMTLITCANWNTETEKYDSRLVVRARLVNTVTGERSSMDIQ